VRAERGLVRAVRGRVRAERGLVRAALVGGAAVSWRQPWDVACPVCGARDGRLCNTVDRKRLRFELPPGHAAGAPAHWERWQASLRGKKVPMA
jgi:hypothetical protein